MVWNVKLNENDQQWSSENTLPQSTHTLLRLRYILCHLQSGHVAEGRHRSMAEGAEGPARTVTVQGG